MPRYNESAIKYVWFSENPEVERKTCPKVVSDSGNSITIHDEGYVLTITCSRGYQFPDGTSQRSVICVDRGRWSSNIPRCSGNLINWYAFEKYTLAEWQENAV